MRVQFAPPNELITIPDGWHGAGKEGEVLVHVGDMLTKPISGTELPAAGFLHWSLGQRFSLVDSEDNPVAVKTAVAILEGPLYSWGDNKPVLRLTRSNGEGQPVEIQFYGGATNPWIEKLSRIGNKSR